jgi:hypothetical protein
MSKGGIAAIPPLTVLTIQLTTSVLFLWVFATVQGLGMSLIIGAVSQIARLQSNHE